MRTFFQFVAAGNAGADHAMYDSDGSIHESDIKELWDNINDMLTMHVVRNQYDDDYAIVREHLKDMTFEKFAEELRELTIVLAQPNIDSEQYDLVVVTLVDGQHYRCDFGGYDVSWGFNDGIEYSQWTDVREVTPIEKTITVFE